MIGVLKFKEIREKIYILREKSYTFVAAVWERECVIVFYNFN